MGPHICDLTSSLGVPEVPATLSTLNFNAGSTLSAGAAQQS